MTILIFLFFAVPKPTFIPLDGEDQTSEEDLEKLRKKRILDARLYSKLRETLLQVVHLVLLIIMCYDNRSAIFFRQNQTIRDMLPSEKTQVCAFLVWYIYIPIFLSIYCRMECDQTGILNTGKIYTVHVRT